MKRLFILGFMALAPACAQIVKELTAAMEPDYVVLGGGNAKKLKKLPPRARLGANEDAFAGGYRLWSK